MSTNLLGLALVILNMNIVTNYATNHVGITCKESDCTNQVEMKTLEEITKFKACSLHKNFPMFDNHGPCECIQAVYKTNTVKGCMYFHTKLKVVPTCKREIIIIGTKDNPMYRVTTQTPLEDGFNFIIYHPGTFIERIEK